MIGILWFEPSVNKSLWVKIEEGKDHLFRKHGMVANCCDVNPTTLETYSLDDIRFTEKRLGIKIRPTVSVQTNHYFIGVNEGISLEMDEN